MSERVEEREGENTTFEHEWSAVTARLVVLIDRVDDGGVDPLIRTHDHRQRCVDATRNNQGLN